MEDSYEQIYNWIKDDSITLDQKLNLIKELSDSGCEVSNAHLYDISLKYGFCDCDFFRTIIKRLDTVYYGLLEYAIRSECCVSLLKDMISQVNHLSIDDLSTLLIEFMEHSLAYTPKEVSDISDLFQERNIPIHFHHCNFIKDPIIKKNIIGYINRTKRQRAILVTSAVIDFTIDKGFVQTVTFIPNPKNLNVQVLYPDCYFYISQKFNVSKDRIDIEDITFNFEDGIRWLLDN